MNLTDKIAAALKWAKEAAEAERARVDAAGEDAVIPSWLPELESALQQVDCHEMTDEEDAAMVAAHEARKDFITSRRVVPKFNVRVQPLINMSTAKPKLRVIDMSGTELFSGADCYAKYLHDSEMMLAGKRYRVVGVNPGACRVIIVSRL